MDECYAIMMSIHVVLADPDWKQRGLYLIGEHDITISYSWLLKFA